MSYVIRNIRPSVIHIPDAGLRLDPGQKVVVEKLSSQMDELLAIRALETISSNLNPLVATTPVETSLITPVVTLFAAKATTPVITEKKSRKSITEALEKSDDVQ